MLRILAPQLISRSQGKFVEEPVGHVEGGAPHLKEKAPFKMWLVAAAMVIRSGADPGGQQRLVGVPQVVSVISSFFWLRINP